MLNIITALALAFVAGLVVKTVDWIDDERKGKNLLKWPLAVIYGIAIGYLISQASFSTLFLAALFAQVFAGKIDTHTHVLGFAIAMFSLFFFGVPQPEPLLFLFFALLAFLDEAEFMGRLHPLMEYRPFLPLGAALLVIPLGRFDYFLGIIAFDIGYVLFGFLRNKVFKTK